MHNNYGLDHSPKKQLYIESGTNEKEYCFYSYMYIIYIYNIIDIII